MTPEQEIILWVVAGSYAILGLFFTCTRRCWSTKSIGGFKVMMFVCGPVMIIIALLFALAFGLAWLFGDEI